MKPSDAANDNLIDRTIALWKPRLRRDLSREDARRIAENVTGFFNILAEWSRTVFGDVDLRVYTKDGADVGEQQRPDIVVLDELVRAARGETASTPGQGRPINLPHPEPSPVAVDGAEVVAALTPETNQARRWRERFTARTFEWQGRKREWQKAEQLAWGDILNEWHLLHGRRSPAWQCAGCGQPISGLEVIELPDCNRVHFEPIDCLLRFGRRWRSDAEVALLALGLEPPDAEARGPD